MHRDEFGVIPPEYKPVLTKKEEDEDEEKPKEEKKESDSE